MLFYLHAYIFYTHPHRLTWPIIEGKYRGGDYSKTFQSGRVDKKTVPVNTKTTRRQPRGNQIKVPSTSQRVMGYSYTKPSGIRQKNDFTLSTKTFIGLLNR